MYSFQPAPTQTQVAPTQRAFQSVTVNVPGRLMLASYEEFPCDAVDMSPGDVSFTCAGRPAVGERVVAYLDHLGRLEGNVTALTANGFVMSINATDRKREKLAAQLTWIANKHELGLPEDRRHDRLAPRNTRAEITLDDGRRYACRIMDLSLSGAAIDIDIRPALGTAVRLGSMRGRVVRHFMEGVAIEFSSVQSRETLTEFL
ncbi:pilus assembly protein PilZ [Neorhizobium sp. SOG26]|jgi:Imidazoleglycerol-phosphate dehydratase|uniref:PilZ domain-containing protein n=1 Tax=Neorhizobium turbinariae TaxID=2937795 RepID=A0ABT0ILJ0_9HYPH|nr:MULTISPECIES: PilZ domain-containing protein [Neorhizobium]AXV15601.1 pilus assembly protein PilZ [Neorhizobium sp. SOG26]MCK8778739.1 PilZ domain-containing protein [Neorhizobium turbinariae]